MTSQELTQLIRSRRAVFPEMYLPQEISEQEIREILENASWAPTHKKTEPWRFIVFQGSGRADIADWITARYTAHATQAGDFSETKREKFRHKVMSSGCVIGICMQPDPAHRLPEWEELAAVSCAVQNMWLTCTAMQIGCYWSSPAFVTGSEDMPGMQPEWQCLGLFYMGRWSGEVLPAKRAPIEEKTIWINTSK